MRILSLFLLPFLLCYCTTNPNKAKEIETSMEKEKALNDEQSIGVRDGDMVYQKKVDMAEELRRLHINVYSLEDRVYGNRKFGSLGLYGVLKKCRSEKVDPRNGGDGKLMWTEPLDRVTDKEDDFDIGYNDNKLVGVSQEFLIDRIKRFKDYRRVLQKREDEYQEKIDICETALKAQQFKRNQKIEKAEKSEKTEG